MAGSMMGKLLLGILLLSLLWGCLDSQEEEGEIGLLHMETLVAKSMRAQSFQKQLDTRGQEIQREYDAISGSLDDLSRSQKQQEAYMEFLEYKEELEQELNSIIEEKLEAICQELNIRVVLNKTGIHYGGLDITAAVIQALEEEY